MKNIKDFINEAKRQLTGKEVYSKLIEYKHFEVLEPTSSDNYALSHKDELTDKGIELIVKGVHPQVFGKNWISVYKGKDHPNFKDSRFSNDNIEERKKILKSMFAKYWDDANIKIILDKYSNGGEKRYQYEIHFGNKPCELIFNVVSNSTPIEEFKRLTY